MSPLAILQAIQTLIMVGAGGVAWKALQLAAQAGKLSAEVEARFQRIEARQVEVEKRLQDMRGDIMKRLDDAGDKTSWLATQVQGMPERMRETFLSLEMAKQYVEESREDRRHLWAAMRREPSARTRRTD